MSRCGAVPASTAPRRRHVPQQTVGTGGVHGVARLAESVDLSPETAASAALARCVHVPASSTPGTRRSIAARRCGPRHRHAGALQAGVHFEVHPQRPAGRNRESRDIGDGAFRRDGDFHTGGRGGGHAV